MGDVEKSACSNVLLTTRDLDSSILESSSSENYRHTKTNAIAEPKLIKGSLFYSDSSSKRLRKPEEEKVICSCWPFIK